MDHDSQFTDETRWVQLTPPGSGCSIAIGEGLTSSGRVFDDEPIATMFNEMPKYVVSKTLSDATRNITTLINADIAAGIRDLKDRAPTE